MSLVPLFPVIQKAANIVAKNYPGFIEPDDLAQEIALVVAQSPATLKRLMDYVEAAQVEALKKIAVQQASKMRDDYEVFSGQYQYGVDEVREALEKGLLEGLDWKTSDIAMDCKQAVLDISDRYCRLLALRYYDGLVPEQGADAVATTRAVSDLTKRMNRHRAIRRREFAAGDRDRKPTYTNEEAIDVTRADYDGNPEELPLSGWDHEED